VSAREPTFSVVVPTRRRPAALARCLGGLVGLDYDPEAFEVVVVADGEAPASFDPPNPLRTRLVVRERAGPAAARNAGAAEARGRFLAFLDDDCVPAPGWLRALAPVLDSNPAAAVRGRVVNALGRNPFSEATQVIVDYLLETSEYLPTMNFALEARLFAQTGGFDESFPWAGEDREFSARWVAAGREILTADDAVVEHAHDLGALSFAQQHFRYGRGSLRFRQVTGQLGLEPPSYYARLLGHPWRHERAVTPLARAALVAGAQVATAGGFLWEAASRGLSRNGGGGIRTHEAPRDA
jgi:GT2 family glycosyltransferase